MEKKFNIQYPLVKNKVSVDLKKGIVTVKLIPLTAKERFWAWLREVRDMGLYSDKNDLQACREYFKLGYVSTSRKK